MDCAPGCNCKDGFAIVFYCLYYLYIVNDLLSVTLLFGAASYPREGKTFEELLRKAQNQLYNYRNSQGDE